MEALLTIHHTQKTHLITHLVGIFELHPSLGGGQVEVVAVVDGESVAFPHRPYRGQPDLVAVRREATLLLWWSW